jgi:branched-chain amino acid aminotransferase
LRPCQRLGEETFPQADSLDGNLDNLARGGIQKFDGNTALYIRPVYWAEKEGPWVQAHDPESTERCLSFYGAPMRTRKGFSITLSPYRRPTLETMPVDAKAGCLCPNNSRSLFEAQARGFDNAIVCDMLGNVAELATSNIFMAKDGIVFTPLPNGTFLAGITRQRVISLLRDSGASRTTCASKWGNHVTRIGCRNRCTPAGKHYRRR